MVVLIALLTYMLHLVALPQGWSTTDYDSTTRPTANAVIGRDGTIAVLLSRPSDVPGEGSRTLLVVHPNGRSVILRSNSIVGPPQFLRRLGASSCAQDKSDCWFTNVVLADDGTPFVTASYAFSGAYGGAVYGAFAWNGAWHYVPSLKPFAGLGLPSEPENVLIAAAESIQAFAYVGNHSDTYPGEDLNVAATDPKLLDLSAASFDSRRFALGLGNATAMRGSFVGGFDDGLGLVATSNPSTAVLWRCAGARRRCQRSNLGVGVAYGVDPAGEAVGTSAEHEVNCRSSDYRPMLWRNGKAVELSESDGQAYAISDRGTIVGTMGDICGPRFVRGFVADARATPRRARPLDDLVSNLAGRHVVDGFGIDNAGRILCYVADARGRNKRLALLLPR